MEISVRDGNQLMDIAKERHDNGEKDMYHFCVEKGKNTTVISPKNNMEDTCSC